MAPLVSYREAHTKMIHVFVQGLSDFKAIVHETSAYQLFYTIYNPLLVAGASGKSAPGARTGALTDSNKQSATEIDLLLRPLLDDQQIM